MGHAVEFASLEIRNRIAAETVWAAVATDVEVGRPQLYAAARKLWGEGFQQPDSAAGRLLLLAGQGGIPYGGKRTRRVKTALSEPGRTQPL